MAFTRLFDILSFQAERYPNSQAFNHKIDNQWKSISLHQGRLIIDQLSAFYLKKGIKKGDQIALMTSYNSPIWHFVDFAALQLGIVVIPIHSNYSQAELQTIFQEIDPKLIYVSDIDFISILKPNINPECELIAFSKNEMVDDWEKGLEPITEDDTSRIESIKSTILPPDLATIIYTSGSTGLPKGVMLSHQNLVSNIRSVMILHPINYRSRVLSFLPISHVFERMICYCYLAIGAAIYYEDDISNLRNSLQEVKPHFMTSVPRVLEKVYNLLGEEIRKKPLVMRKLLSWSLKTATENEKSFWSNPLIGLKLFVADVLLYRKLRKVFGGHIKGIGVGGASLPIHLSRLFNTAGLLVREGYGLTETSPIVSFNRFEPGNFRHGTAGLPVPGVRVKIASTEPNIDGEILVKGPSVMMGYYKNEPVTKEKIDSDGWFRTGDIGRWEDGKFLKISDRKKNIFKTTSGRYIYPHTIEDALKKIVLIDQCMIIGYNRPFISALIVPDFGALKSWCHENKIHWTAEQYIVLNPKVIDKFEDEIAKINASLKSVEKIRKFKLLHLEWSVDTGEYSTTLKLKRKYINQKYQKEIEKIYAQ